MNLPSQHQKQRNCKPTWNTHTHTHTHRDDNIKCLQMTQELWCIKVYVTYAIEKTQKLLPENSNSQRRMTKSTLTAIDSTIHCLVKCADGQYYDDEQLWLLLLLINWFWWPYCRDTIQLSVVYDNHYIQRPGAAFWKFLSKILERFLNLWQYLRKHIPDIFSLYLPIHDLTSCNNVQHNAKNKKS